MNYKGASILNILIPSILLFILMIVALASHTLVLAQSILTIIVVFAALAVYILLWALMKPDLYSRNAGYIIGLLFILNISQKTFITTQMDTPNWVFTTIMMVIIFITFGVISWYKTKQTNSIFAGIKSSFVSALLGTVIALCFGFLINSLFSEKMLYILQDNSGFKNYKNPKAYIFFHAFDNAFTHVIMGPFFSLVFGSLGALTARLMYKMKQEKNLDHPSL